MIDQPGNTGSVSSNGQPAPPLLGFSTDQLAGLTVDQIEGNRTAITMLLHYYKQLNDENQALRNQNNTYKTYIDAYSNKKLFSIISGALFLASNVAIGFGVNLLSSPGSEHTGAGLSALIPGLVFAALGTAFTFKEPR